MRSLRPSMRENKRYLLVKGKNLRKNIEKAIIDFIGVSGMSKTGLSFINSDQSSDSAIICINRNIVNQVRASLTICPNKMTVVKVSGTLKGLERK